VRGPVRRGGDVRPLNSVVRAHRRGTVKIVTALAASLGLASSAAGGAVNIKHEEFVLKLGGDWTQVKSLDPEQFSFESKKMKTSLVLSVMGSLNIRKDKLVETAKKFAQVRQDAEKLARPHLNIQFGDQWVELKPSGDIAEVAYAGFDPSGTVFRFFGFVTQRKIVSFWVATETRDNEFSKKVFDEVFRGFKFYAP
jgi:hypothetical protein